MLQWPQKIFGGPHKARGPQFGHVCIIGLFTWSKYHSPLSGEVWTRRPNDDSPIPIRRCTSTPIRNLNNKEVTRWVNFTNIYENFAHCFYVLTFYVCTFWRNNISAKADFKMLVKLTTNLLVDKWSKWILPTFGARHKCARKQSWARKPPYSFTNKNCRDVDVLLIHSLYTMPVSSV